MKKVMILLAFVVFFIGFLNIGDVNEKIEKTTFDSAGTYVQPGNPTYVQTMNTAQIIAAYWYLLLAALLLFIAWVV